MSTTPVTLRNATDTYVTSAKPNSIPANSNRLYVGGSGSRYAYIYFPRSFPLGATILNARLRIWMVAPPAGGRTVTIKRVNESWKQSKTKWTNRPGVLNGLAVSDTQNGGSAAVEYSFDVKDHLQLVADGAGWYGWRIEMASTNVYNFYSAQAKQGQPMLEITYTTRPDKPTTLTPSGGQVISAEKPTLSFDFTDTAGSTSMKAYQVQINPTNSFTSPAFDTGTVLSSVPQADLSETAYAGLADGATAYWRVRVQDGSGQWSPWSSAVSFSRRTEGTLTLTSPSGNTVAETTPPITWTFTGRTQGSFQVIVIDKAGKWIHNSGRRTTEDNIYTLPANVIKSEVDPYRIVVRVWDTYNRVTIPGDTAYVQATHTVTMTKDTGTPGVTDFALTPLTDMPGVALTWSRATMPDKFIIKRDDEIIETVVEPQDLLISGSTTDYRYVEMSATPNESHTWTVMAVVNGKTSGTNPTVTHTIKVTGIWLADPEREIGVFLLGDDDGTWGMGEEAGVYTPVGGNATVRVTQALRGYEGSLSGLLMESQLSSKTLAQMEDDVWELKRTPGAVYRLVLHGLNIPVVIGNVVMAPSPRKEPEKKVSFDFWQVGELPFKAVV